MLLIEADGKSFLPSAGIVTPDGILVPGADGLPTLPGSGPWMVKAQVPVGGRGKAGGIVRCQSAAEAAEAVGRLLGRRVKGHDVQACLIETMAEGEERY